MGSSFENFTLALRKFCKCSKKIKAQSLKYSLSWLKKLHAVRPPSVRKGPQSFAHCVVEKPTLKVVYSFLKFFSSLKDYSIKFKMRSISIFL